MSLYPPENPPEYYMEETKPVISEETIEIYNYDGEVIAEVDIQIGVECEYILTAYYKDREIIHLKESFFQSIFEASGILSRNLEHNFKL